MIFAVSIQQDKNIFIIYRHFLLLWRFALEQYTPSLFAIRTAVVIFLATVAEIFVSFYFYNLTLIKN